MSKTGKLCDHGQIKSKVYNFGFEPETSIII